MKIKLSHRYEDIISVENLLFAWQEFIKGKRNKQDVQDFSLHLMDNIISLHNNLANQTYKHGGYCAFNISDPKPRNIHKATVRDRLLHHAIYRILYPFFDRTFMADSFSCRINKGTHKAVKRFQKFSRIISKNNTRTCWILKCDIKKFFANIDHGILLNILKEYIEDEKILGLLEKVIGSFSSYRKGVGLPLGNLTSQLFVNIYMNKFDQFIKHKLKIKYYIRYCDDFVILSANRGQLESLISIIKKFLQEELKLELHPNKVFIKTYASGVDFLGWVHFPHYRQIRTTTKRKVMRKLKSYPKPQTINSYRGLLGHGNTYKIKKLVGID